jgi:hypothetical protein
MRRMAIDAGKLGRGRHIIHGLLELDVTEARRTIRNHKSATGEALSFTAFIISCLAKAVEGHKEVQAILDWRGRLVIFEDVNVTTMVEIEGKAGKIVMPLLIQSANRKSFRQIHAEIRAAQASPAKTGEHRFMKWFLLLPGLARRLFYWFISRVLPQYTRNYMSSVIVTAVGMFGGGGGWGIPLPYFPLSVTLGGISEKPGVVAGRIEIREFLCVTLSFDHDAIDGAPAARFTKQFRELVEGGYGLEEYFTTALENGLLKKNSLFDVSMQFLPSDIRDSQTFSKNSVLR